MCAQYQVELNSNVLNTDFNIKISDSLNSFKSRLLPYQPAPVIVKNKTGQLQLVKMNFSLVPSWSKDAKLKFATHNARIETVTTKPTWRIPFAKQHCIIPIQSFYESVHEGPLAGHIIEFSQIKNEQLYAAGIFDCWINPNTQKSVFSFAILTTDPSPFILDNGHDRSPIFLNPRDALDWLNIELTAEQFIEFLKTRKIEPKLTVKTDRPLKKFNSTKKNPSINKDSL